MEFFDPDIIETAPSVFTRKFASILFLRHVKEP
jgi:hypothetical protein